MFCIKCGQKKIAVINSRKAASKIQVWRRRQCGHCGFIFTTYESLATDQLSVKSNVTTTPFDDTELLFDIGRCLEHIDANKKAPHAKWLTDTIIHKIIALSSKTTVTTKAIATLTYETLKQYDRIASVQYAARHSDKLKVKL